MGKYDETIRQYLAQRGVDRLNIKAALIDMDGVLYDSMRNHTIAWKMMFDNLGLNTDRGCARWGAFSLPHIVACGANVGLFTM